MSNTSAINNIDAMTDCLPFICNNQSSVDTNQSNVSSSQLKDKRLARSVLFMDNMGAHRRESVRQLTNELNIRCEFIPPNCTPHLQPLDHSLNDKFKDVYGEKHNEWFAEVGWKLKTKKNNYKKASVNDVNRWVVSAWHSITTEHIVKCWQHTLNGAITVKSAIDRVLTRGQCVLLPRMEWSHDEATLSSSIENDVIHADRE
jgi:hypothetical protein